MFKQIIRRLGQVICGRCIPRLAYPVLCGPLRGAKLILGSLSGEGGGASVYFNEGCERDQTQTFQETVKPGDIVFDIGANVGFYTLLGSRLVGNSGRVIAFEPVIQNLSYLERHVRMNRLRNVMILAVACADSNSLLTFRSGVNRATGHLADTSQDAGIYQTGHSVWVPALTVDEFVAKSGLLPKVIKIDVEGAELHVLKGAQQSLIAAKPKIFLSIHSAQLRSVCLDYLQQKGYSAHPLNGNVSEATEYLASAD